MNTPNEGQHRSLPPYVINICNMQYHKLEREDVYVGRGTPFGNLNAISEGLTRDEACDAYEYDFHRDIKDPNSPLSIALDTLEAKLLRNRVLNLVCHCAPLRCHAQTIKNYLLKKYQPPLT